MLHGVLDRIEDGIATILIDKINKEFTVPHNELPTGSTEGTWFTLLKHGDTFVINEIDQEKTAFESQQSKNVMNQLKARKKTSKFKRK